jgi:hypothetical protein
MADGSNHAISEGVEVIGQFRGFVNVELAFERDETEGEPLQRVWETDPTTGTRIDGLDPSQVRSEPAHGILGR